MFGLWKRQRAKLCTILLSEVLTLLLGVNETGTIRSFPLCALLTVEVSSRIQPIRSASNTPPAELKACSLDKLDARMYSTTQTIM